MTVMAREWLSIMGGHVATADYPWAAETQLLAGYSGALESPSLTHGHLVCAWIGCGVFRAPQS